MVGAAIEDCAGTISGGESFTSGATRATKAWRLLAKAAAPEMLDPRTAPLKRCTRSQ
jgi:hypothetical protein